MLLENAERKAHGTVVQAVAVRSKLAGRHGSKIQDG